MEGDIRERYMVVEEWASGEVVVSTRWIGSVAEAEEGAIF